MQTVWILSVVSEISNKRDISDFAVVLSFDGYLPYLYYIYELTMLSAAQTTQCRMMLWLVNMNPERLRL
jgi:hypothetical protein